MTTESDANAGDDNAGAQSRPSTIAATARAGDAGTPQDSAAAQPPAPPTAEVGDEPEVCTLTKVQYTDTPVHTDHQTLVQTAQWLQDSVDRETTDTESEIGNPLEGLLRDDRRQVVPPEGREKLLDLMDRMADGLTKAPDSADETDAQAMKDTVRFLHTQITADHAERPGDSLLYELN